MLLEEKMFAEEIHNQLYLLFKDIRDVMPTEEKKEFAYNVIKPIIGQMNYLECKDIRKLLILLDETKKLHDRVIQGIPEINIDEWNKLVGA